MPSPAVKPVTTSFVRRHTRVRPALYGLLLLALAFTLSPVLTRPGLAQEADEQPLPKQEEEPKTLTETLGGEDRYLTHLSTDKPIYRAGETVYVRGTILHAFDRTPIDDNAKEIAQLDEQIGLLRNADKPENNQAIRDLAEQRWQLQQASRLRPNVEIKDPKGAVVVSSQTNIQDSVLGFKWEVPEGQAGGEYTIKVSYPFSGLAPAERTFDIRAYRPPRIKTQIDFLKDGYGPGDTVVATIDATRAEGGIPQGAKVTAIARVDGQEVARVQTMIRESGMAEVRFDLPGQIERGEGSLTFVIEDGGVIESASKTLPILLQTLDLELYPEGGELVAGVPNRVYFEARTPYGKPADVKGVVVNRAGAEVAAFETKHEGRGVFTFSSHSDDLYTIRITEPASITQTFALPKPAIVGATISFDRSVYGYDEPIAFKAGLARLAGVERFTAPLHTVVFRQREAEVYRITRKTIAEANEAQQVERDGQWDMQWQFQPTFDATGILTVTAYDRKGNPLAERLIYRAPKEHVNIEVVPDSAQYTPAGKVQLTIKTTDSEGKPVAAVAGLTVTDDAVLEMIETREQSPNLPAMVFLEQEVDDLADAQVYLDPKNEDAAEQLDLLLGTQGWRRFALVNLEDFIAEHGDAARRMLALRVPVRHEMAEMRRFKGAAMPEAMPMVAEAAPMNLAAANGMADGALADAAEEAFDDAAPAQEPVDGERLQQALEAAAEEEAANGLLANEDADMIAGGLRMQMPPMVFIREYAHKQPAGKPFGQRSDFTETVYWSSATKTNDQGVATVTFDLSDSVTSFRVNADAFTQDGALGAGTALIESVRPFYVEPKLPLELTAGDTVLLPIAMVNNTEQGLPVELTLSKLGQAGKDTISIDTLGADTRSRSLYELKIGAKYGELPFKLTATAGLLCDTNHRTLRVVPKGFPINDGSGGMLQPDGEIKREIIIPESTVPGSLSASVAVYPTPLANLTEALEALIREPSGCFEQTSSTTFPLVMAQQYFLTHQGVDPELIASAKENLDKGYQRLIGFETEQDGYEWFGSTPPHEALTAYGLLQFNEMKQVMDVDQQMIDRTQDWLLSRCGNDGSFKLDPKQLDSFGGAPQDTTNAYIVWSLLEAGYDPQKLAPSIDLVLKNAMEGEDAYIVALGANIAQLAGKDRVFTKTERLQIAMEALPRKLAAKLTDEGFIDGAVTSITRSGGDALKIETTSLAILAWLRDDQYTEQVEQAILWLTERCKTGRFGSTQSTVLALKAIVEYDKARSTPKAPGSLQLLVDGQAVGEAVAFNEETKGAIRLPALASHLTPGKHTVAVQMTGGSKMPYAIAVDYFADTPVSSEECKLRIETKVKPTLITSNSDHVAIGEGETTEVNVKITNVTQGGLPTPIAIVGLPGGLEPDYDQLKELVEANKIAAFEVIGRDVVLYWREMKPEAVVDLSIRCTAAIPGTYTGPASRAYLYYTDEHKHWVDGLTVTVTPRDQE